MPSGYGNVAALPLSDVCAAHLRAPRLGGLLGHTKLESTVRYAGIGVDDALEIAEQTEV